MAPRRTHPRPLQGGEQNKSALPSLGGAGGGLMILSSWSSFPGSRKICNFLTTDRPDRWYDSVVNVRVNR